MIASNDDAKATRKFAILDTLVTTFGASLSPAMIENITDALIEEIENGPAAWAFGAGDDVTPGAPAAIAE